MAANQLLANFHLTESSIPVDLFLICFAGSIMLTDHLLTQSIAIVNQITGGKYVSLRFLVPLTLLACGVGLVVSGFHFSDLREELARSGKWIPLIFVLCGVAAMSVWVPKTAVSLSAIEVAPDRASLACSANSRSLSSCSRRSSSALSPTFAAWMRAMACAAASDSARVAACVRRVRK